MKKLLASGLLILFLPLLAACGGAEPLAEPGTPPPESLNLRDQGLTDIAYLSEYTWLSRLDLRGNEISIEAYDALAAALPDCDIRWSVPIAGQRVDNDAVHLRVDSFDAQDADALAYFPSLKSVNAQGCTDYAALMAAAERYDALRFSWTVPLGAHSFSNTDTTLDLSGEELEPAELRVALDSLPALSEVDLRGVPMEDADKLSLLTDYPHIAFLWTVELLPGVTADSADSELDLRGQKIADVDALLEKLRLLPALKRLDMCECGPSNEEMMRLREALPDTKVIWMVDVASYRVRTDILGISTGQTNRFPNGGGYVIGACNYYQIYNGDFDNLKYCTDIVALDIGHCVNISDISFLANMPKLTYLILAMIKIDDISALATQTELEYLEIFDNKVADITPLRNCTKLRFLNCSNNPFTDLDTLLMLTKLERLWITASSLTDEQLVQLREGLPDTYINDSRNRQALDHYWRRGNWAYVDMQRIYGLRAQFQYGITPTPELPPTPTPAP